MKKEQKRLIKLFLYDKKSLVLMLLFGFIQTMTITSVPYLLKTIVSESSNFNILNLPFIIFIIALFLVIGIIMYITPILIDIFYTKLGVNIGFKLQSDIIKKIYSSKLELFNTFNISDILRMTISDIDEFKKNASYLIWAVFHLIFQLIALIFYMSLINPIVFFALLLWYLLFFIATGKLTKKISETRKDERDYYSKYIASLKDSIQGNLDLRFLGSFPLILNKIFRIKNNYLKVNIKTIIASGRYQYLTNVCQMIGNILLIIMIIFLKGKYKMDPLSSLTIFSYTFYMFPIVSQLFTLKSSFNYINGLFYSIYKILDDKNNFYDSGTFKIDNIDEIKINNFIFKKNNIFIIKGNSGCGKTTLIKKILKLIDNDIKIEVNNIPLNQINIESYHKKILFIPQDVYLFASTLFENINFDKVDNLNEIGYSNIIELLGLYNLKERLDENTGEAGNEKISGGEKKRIGIARAILKVNDKDLIIFDETFSNLDYKNKENILNNLLANVFINKIVIIITHDDEIEKIIKLANSSINLKVIYFENI